MSQVAAEASIAWAAGLDLALATALRWLCIVCMFVLVVLVSALVLIRFFPIISLGWADEIVELIFAWMVFLGTAAVWRSNEHITIDFIPQALAGTRAGRVLEAVVCLLILAFLAVFTWQGWLLTLQAVGNRTPILELPKPAWYVVVPMSGVVMIGYTLRRGLQAVRPARPDQ
jgi:TRAP-type C4-dicarboxylate transport system permease small subunit